MALTPRRAAASIVLAASGYGFLSIATTLAAQRGTGLPTLMAWRYTIAAPILAAIAGWDEVRDVVRYDWRRAVGLLVLGGGGQSFVTFTSLYALKWIPAASLSFLFFTYPAWVALFAAMNGTERLTRSRVLALLLALGGITAMVGAPWRLHFPLIGVALALIASMAYALYIPMLHKLRGTLSAAGASTYTIAGAALIFLVLSWREGGPIAPMTPFTMTLGVTIAIWGTVVTFIGFLSGLATLGPVRAAILSTAEPFFTAVYAMLLLDQPLTGKTLIGGAAIIGAIILLERRTPPTPDVPAPA